MKAHKPEHRPRFDIDTLGEIAGEKVFARGEVYYRSGQVQLLAIEPGRVLAQVEGTEDYRTELTGGGDRIGGNCSCPAFEDWGVCKHMVAVALAANAASMDANAEGVGALSRIRAHLKQKSVDALVGIIMDLAERDAALFRKLDMAAASVDADDKTLRTRLCKTIDAATRTRGFVEYHEAPGWAANVDAALDAFADLVSGSRSSLALELAEYAVDRIERAIEEIDDSDGHCGALLERARGIHFAAAETAQPESMQFARDLFAREVNGSYGTFSGAVALYAEILGEEGLAEYHRLAAEAWEKLSRHKARSDDDDGLPGDLALRDILDFFAERAGDVDGRIALRSRDLSSPWQYLQLAQFCLAQGRRDEALRRAEEGLWLFEDGRLDERLVSFTVELLSDAGRKEEAEAHLWKAFEKAPSLGFYAQLRQLGGASVLHRVTRILEARIVRNERVHWSAPASLLADILMEEKMFDEAWAVVREHRAAVGTRQALARLSEATHPREALEVYAEQVDQLVGTGSNSAYAEAVRLIARMAGLRSAAEHAAYVAAFKERYGRKRNLMKLLG